MRFEDLLKGAIRKSMMYIMHIIYRGGGGANGSVLFCAFSGKQYSDSPRAISEKLHELYPEIPIVWLFKNDTLKSNVPSYIKKVDIDSKEAYVARAKASVIVLNEAVVYGTYKGKNQFYIQTWHGDRGFKKMLWAAHGNDCNYVPPADDKVTDLCVAASQFGVDVYRNSFRYTGEILCEGMPRNDALVHPSSSRIKSIKKFIGVQDSCKILLYAPTFRRNVSKQSANMDLNRILDCLERKTNCRWKCFVRAHVVSNGISGINFNSDRFMDLTKYHDMTDLLLISDMLITDYSSCACDFILQNKPVILSIYDIDSYVSSQREFAVPPTDVGFYVAKNDDEFESIIAQMDDEDVKRECKEVLHYFDTHESGVSSEIICNIIKTRHDEFVKRN